MYDKVKLWIDRAIVGNQCPAIANYLDSARQETDLQTGEVKISGCLDGLRVSVSIGGVSVVGSLAKFMFDGSNVYSLDRRTATQAIEKLADTLHVPVDDAAVTELEFGTNFLMMNQVSAYLSRLGAMPRMSRLNINPTSLYYKGNGKQQPKIFAFYDKILDAKTKGMDFPKDMRDANLLRYEIRYRGRLPQQLKWPEVTASTLTQKAFYKMMVKRYQECYFSISKMNQIKTDVMSEIKNVTDAFNVFVARLISQSNQAQIWGFLEELKEAAVFEDRKSYSRLKKKIQDVATKANITMSDELMKELDDDIKNCGAYM